MTSTRQHRQLVGFALALILVFASAAHAGRIGAGWGHAVFVLPNGTVWTWGANNNGQTGEPLVSHPRPMAVPGLPNIVAVAAGSSHCLALAADGTVWGWGLNNSGQIGNGTTLLAWEPVQLGLSSIVAIAAGNLHSVALASDGTVYTWGYNPSGQLGNNTTTNTNAPAPVAGIQAIAIAAGPSHTVVVASNGTVWGWGENSSGQLGDGSTTRRLTPVQMTGITTAVAVTAASVTSHVLLADGTVRSTGGNGNGTIGDGTTTGRTSPVLVSTLTEIVEIAAAYTHVVARKSDGTVWTWGGNSRGELGLGDKTIRTVPTQVTSLSNVAHLGVGDYNSYAVTSDSAPLGQEGIVYSWGSNTSGQLGDGTAVDSAVPLDITASGYRLRVATPRLSYASGTYSSILPVQVSDITTGVAIHYTLDGSEPTISDPQVANNGTVTIDRSLTLKARAFKPGTPDSHAATATYVLVLPSPTHTPWGTTFTSPQSVSLSSPVAGTTIRYTTDGSLPTSSSALYVSPIVVGTTTTIKAVAFRTGWTSSPSSSSTYTVNYGTLAAPSFSAGAGTYEGSINVAIAAAPGTTIRYTTNSSEPTASSTVYAQPVTIGLTTTLKAKAFQVDHTPSATTTSVYTIQMAAPVLTLASGQYEPGESVTIIGADASATIRMSLTGADPTTADPPVASGSSFFIGNFTLKAKASKAGCLDSAVVSATYTLTRPLGAGSVSGGGSHTLIASPDGRVYGFGANSSSQLGDGSTSQRTTPTVIPTLTGVIAVTAGQWHSLALTPDGQVWSWGSNGYGRLGDGTTTTRSRPVQVAGLTDVVAISAGGSHSLALTAGGQVFGWGLNSNGQLGIGSTTSQFVPVPIPGLINVAAIAAGANHSLAITRSGQLYAWGANPFGQLGDGTTTQRTSPTVVAGIASVESIAAGTNHSLARVQGGAVYAWGYGGNGQLGLGTTINKTAPTLVAGLTAIDITAAGSTSFAQRTDGVLVGWGANNSGQVGDTTTSQRNSPTVVNGPAVVALIKPGDTHAVAVTPDGHVWTWGAGSSGQRGDGTTAAIRATPLDVFTLAGNWGATPAPVLSLAPATYNSPQTLVVSGALDGTIVRYTTDGADPTEIDPEIPTNGEFAIDGTRLFRFRAWAAGLPPSRVVPGTYVLQPLPPTISPGSGTYTSAQSVTLASPTSDTVVRYTTDGSDPTDTSPIYVSSFTVSTTATLKARAFRTNWTDSPVATTVMTFDYGTLTAPAALPGSGTYALGQTVSLAAANAVIHYTLDGTEPSSASSIYVEPIVLPEGTTVLKARAYRVDWTPSPVASWAYQTSSDANPPTITASLSASPNTYGWYNEPVTVTFSCEDAESGISYCQPPAVVSADAEDIAVIGEAVDGAGNHASVTVTVNMDRSAPYVSLHSPRPTDIMPAGTGVVTIRGGVLDAVAGIALVTCNNVPATVAAQAYSCDVPLGEGTSTVQIVARDRAGNDRQTTAAVTVGDAPPPTSLTITPTKLTIWSGEVRDLRIIDQAGRPLQGGTWAVDQSGIAEINDHEGRFSVQGLSPGTVTFTFTRDGLSDQLFVTVLAAGDGYPSDVILWELTPSVSGPPQRATIVPAVSPGLSSGEESSAYFFVDEGTLQAGGVIYRPNDRPTEIRAVTRDGRVMWTYSFADGVPRQLAADASGGLLILLDHTYGSETPLPERVRRIDGLTGVISWEFFARDGSLTEFAVHPDGTVYLAEEAYHRPGTDFIKLDGSTGSPARFPLPRGNTAYPPATGPIVLGDGSAILLASGGGQTYAARIDSEGSFSTTPLTVSGPYAPDFLGSRLVIANDGSILIADRQQPVVARYDPSSSTIGPSQWLVPEGSSWRQAYETEYVIGFSGAAALIKRFDGPNQIMGRVMFDPVAPTDQFPTPMGDTDQAQLRFISSSGSVHVSGATTGLLGANDTQVSPGVWAGWTAQGAPITYHADVPIYGSWAYVRGYGSTNSLNPWRSNFNAIKIATSFTPQQVFDQYVRTYAGVNAGTVCTVTVPDGAVSGVGQVLTFTLQGTLGSLLGPFSVRTIRYEPSVYTIAVETVPGHPLVGWRYWRVKELWPGRITIETGAYDKVAPTVESELGDLMFSNDQIKVWQEYLSYIASTIQDAQIRYEPPYATQAHMGVWGYNRKYIMENVCGHEPTRFGFCQ